MDVKKPYVVAFLVYSMYAGMYMVSKVALNQGMNPLVFVLYRQAIATMFVTPVALVRERKKAPPFSFMVFLKIFLVSLFGITASLNLYGVALQYTSATLAAATDNSIPVTTFFLALVLRMEKLKVRSIVGITKLLGVTLCGAGFMVMAFYTGPLLNLNLLHHHHHQTSPAQNNNYRSKRTWIKGAFLMITSFSAWSLWIVLQGKLLREYPTKLLLTALQCFFSLAQSLCITLAFVRDFSKWKLGFDMGLLAVVYSGVIVSGIAVYLQAWCIQKKGPVFLAMFTPVAFVLTTVLSGLLLGDLTSLGSILGGVLMVGGLYGVLWGKSKEKATDHEVQLPVAVERTSDGKEEEVATVISDEKA